MISIKEPKDCCGCNACAQRCPKHCITLTECHEGFLYPKVNTELCIECGLCEKVCPVINQGTPKEPLEIYAAINPNEKIRKESSSGGIFTLLAEKIIQENGVVFGARFDDNWEVKHDYTETIEGLAAFRGSKYVQSRIEDNYMKAEKFLKEGRKVLFSGTPCQIAGLKKFLRKEYDNLLTVDLICHGVPSPKVWRMYLDETCRNLIERSGKSSVSSVLTDGEKKYYIEAISFRNKILGWEKYSFFLKLNSAFTQDGKNTEGFFEPASENVFMKAFLSDIILRPSCYRCPSKNGKSNSDITIADFWGVHTVLKDFDDDKGTNLTFINTQHGKDIFPFDKINYHKVQYNNIKPLAKGLQENLIEHKHRTYFFNQLEKNNSVIKLIKHTTKPTITKRLSNFKIKVIIKIKKLLNIKI